MGAGGWGCSQELVAALSASVEVLLDLPVSAGRLTGADLEAVLEVVDRLAAVAAAGRFTLTGEAERQGLVAVLAGGVAGAVGERTLPGPGPAGGGDGGQGGP